MALFGGQPKPARRFGSVLRHARACAVYVSEHELRIDEALFGGQPVPPHGFGSVLKDAPPAGVHVSEHELRIGETLLGSPAGTSVRLRHCP